MSRRRLHSFSWIWLLFAAGAFVFPAVYEAVAGERWDRPGQVIGAGILSLFVAFRSWRGMVVEITDQHIRKYVRRKQAGELARDRIAGVERTGSLMRLYTHDGAEMWFGSAWPARSRRRLVRLLDLPEPVRLTTGEVRAVIRDWLGAVVMLVLITVLFAAAEVWIAISRGFWHPALSYLVGLNAVAVVIVVVWEFFGGVLVGQDGVRMARGRVVVRRDTIREVVSVKDKGYVRDDADHWFVLGQSQDAAARLAAVLGVPFREADKVEGRVID